MPWMCGGSFSSDAMPTPRVVLFDAVGTLIFPDPPVVEAYWQTGYRFGSRLSRQQIYAAFRVAFPQHHISGQTDESVERKRWRAVVVQVFDDVHDAGTHLF